jgi:hypothetical protein
MLRRRYKLVGRMKKKDISIGSLFYFFVSVISLMMSIEAYFNENCPLTYKNPIVFYIPIVVLLFYFSFYHYHIEDMLTKVFVLILFWIFLTLPFAFENTLAWILSTIIILIVSIVVIAGEEE